MNATPFINLLIESIKLIHQLKEFFHGRAKVFRRLVCNQSKNARNVNIPINGLRSSEHLKLPETQSSTARKKKIKIWSRKCQTVLDWTFFLFPLWGGHGVE